MSLPGFSAEVTLYRPANHYAGTYAAGFSSGVVPTASLPGFETCFLPCMRYYLPGGSFSGADVSTAITTCSIACGMLESAAREALRAYLGLAAAEGGGFFAAEGFGLTGGAAVAAPIVLFGIAILLGAHDIPAALAGPTQQPATTPAGCSGGTYDPSENITGWAIPLKYPGCAGAWDHSQDNAQEVCEAHLTCSGTCANGRPCKAIAILIDRVDETRYFLTCRAEGKYTCQCGCQ